MKKMKNHYYKRGIKYKKSSIRKRKKKLNIKAKNKLKQLSPIFKLLKFIFLILFISFHFFCNNYRKKIIENFYNIRAGQLNRGKVRYNESNLITFMDKLNWLAIHDVIKLKTKCADKILLHEFSKRILKKDICNKILKVYDNPDQINIDELPNQFVLKTNHGSGYNLLFY